MLDMVKTFFRYFIHPIESNRFLGLQRDGLDGEWTGSRPLELGWSEVILFAWFFYFFATFYDLAGLGFGSSFFFTDELKVLTAMKMTGAMLVIKTVAGAVLFPLVLYFRLLISRFFMRLMLKLLGHGPELEQGLNSLLAISISSHFLLLIPAFGNGLQQLFALLYTILGARFQLRLSWGASFLVGFASFFILFGLVIFFALTIGLVGVVNTL